MIKAIFTKSNNKYCSFSCSGHAGFAKKGKDIVCAAVSVLTINACNSISELTEADITAKTEDGYLSWTFNQDCDEKASLIMDSLYLGLSQIQKEYNKILFLEMKEV